MTAAAPRRSARNVLTRIVAGLGLLLAAALAVAAILAFGGDAPGIALPLLGLALVVAICLVATGFAMIDRHFDRLERLRAALVAVAGRSEPPEPGWPGLDPGAGSEAARLADAVGTAVRGHRALAGRADDRLSAVVGAASEGLVAITDSGLVSLVNAGARRVLGQDIGVGSSIYAVLDRDGMAGIEAEIRDSGLPRDARLTLVDGSTVEAVVAPLLAHGGFVISLPGRDAGPPGAVEHDLALHDAAPATRIAAGDPPDDWPLEDLPVLVLDCETTGLDVANDRIVSLGAVRAHGRRIYPRSSLDRLVRPDIPIPAESTGIHGITGPMVAGAPAFPEVFREVEPALRGSAVVGHCIGFDLAILAAECERHGLAWRLPPALDTALVFAALERTDGDPGLEALAQRMGISVEGRHTALGDALVTAELWLGALPLLADRGVRTYGEARRLCAAARPFVMSQRAAGWLAAAG